MKFDDIKVHSIVHVKLSGERIYIAAKGIDGTQQWVTGKRLVHTSDEGDIYKTETWEPDELQTEEEHAAEHEKERSELLDLLRAKGVMVLNDLNTLDSPRDPNAN